jgi:tetratricopeptide (TPR) repeat protein
MSCVSGEKGAYIESLMNQANDEWGKANYEMCLACLEKAWDELPDGKNEYDESYLIISGILGTSILVGDHDRLRKWVDLIFSADPERLDSGERPMWAGRVAYELGEPAKAKEYFEIANKKSGGRCFGLKNDGKYLKFYNEK